LFAKEWDDAISQTLELLRLGLRQLAALQATPPTVGYELANERGSVVAEAEMAWPDKSLVLLTADQEDLAFEWSNAGWTALILSEDCLQVASEPWVYAVASKLNIEINPAKETL
jgi:DEAD/DEAH box helicase domain-containing protein